MEENIFVDIITKGTEVIGKLIFNNSCRISGRVDGVIIGKGKEEIETSLYIEHSSVVNADIFCDTVIINGVVRGDIYGRKKVLIKNTGAIIGKVESPVFEIEEGGIFDGTTVMEGLTPEKVLEASPSL